MATNVELILGKGVDINYARSEPHFGNVREWLARGDAVDIGTLMKIYGDRGKEALGIYLLFE
jgi:hypothetical protein